MPCYRIRDWERLYETSETRKLKRLSWVPTRNNHDGLTFRSMAMRPDRCELFAAWNLILQVASRGDGKDRGTLTRNGDPITPDDLQAMTGFPSKIFVTAYEFFSSHKVRWLEKMREISGDAPETSGESPDVPLLKEGREGKEEKESAPSACLVIPESLKAHPQFLEAWEEWQAFRIAGGLKAKQRKTTFGKQLAQMERWGPQASIESMRQSIMNGWSGVFEPKNGAVKVVEPKRPAVLNLDEKRRYERETGERIE